MKTSILLLITFIFIAGTSFSQDKSVFESAKIVKEEGAPYILLNWKKGSENTAFYLVERSTDGKVFKQAALVFSAENPSLVDYKFRDRDFAHSTEVVYYRISIVNENKEICYLPLQKVVLNANETLFLLENNQQDIAR